MKPVQQSRIHFNTPISAPRATKSLLCSLRWSTARSNSGDVVLVLEFSTPSCDRFSAIAALDQDEKGNTGEPKVRCDPHLGSVIARATLRPRKS
jgi:hypothetical protein